MLKKLKLHMNKINPYIIY